MSTSTAQKNITYFRQQFAAAMGNSSVVVKFVCIAVSVGYLLTFSETAFNFLAVTPGFVTPPNLYFWTYFTHSFIEVHIWCLAVDIGVVVLYGKLLEPLWGALGMLTFYIVVNTGVALATTLVYLFIYMVTRNEEYLFDIHIHGLAGYVAGFSVAVKQVMPDHVLINSPFGKLRNKHIPLMLLYVAILVRIIGIVDGPYPIMFGMGLLVSWLYLRFYQKHSNGNRGDMADSFTFVSFFPETTQPFLAIVANTIFSMLVKIKICKKPQRRYDVSAPTTITVSLPGTDPQDAERRRQLALKALNDRLSKAEPVNWPSMEEAGGEPQTPGGSSASEPTTPSTTPEPKLESASSKQSEKPPASVQAKLPVPDFKENAKASKGESS